MGNQAESQDASGNVQGSYSVALPDGRTQHVNYHADDYAGYVADVSYEGYAAYPEVHHAAPVHHSAPVVHHAAPVVHHAAPVVHHAAGPVVHSHQVHGGSHHGALHEVRAPVVVASAVPVRHAAHHAVHHAPAHHNVVHQVLTPFHDLMSIVRKMMPF